MPLSALAAALFLALFVGAPAANAEDAVPADSGQIIIAPPPSEPPPVEPVPSDPGTPPADTTTPPPGTELPPTDTEPPTQPAPVVPPTVEIPSEVTDAPPVVVGNASPVVPPAARVVPVQPVASAEVVQSPPEPSTAGATPSPSASATKSAVAVPKKAPTAPKAGTEIQAAVVAATGSPFTIQLLTVLALLGAGFAYFRALGSKGFRATAKTGK